MLHDQGLPQAAELAAQIEEAISHGQARAVQAPAVAAGRSERSGAGPAAADRPSPAHPPASTARHPRREPHQAPERRPQPQPGPET